MKHAYYDAEQTTVAALRAMQEALKGSGRGSSKGFFEPLTSSLVAEERMVKDAAEIEQMAAAAALGVRLFEHILGFMRPGIRENAVAAELEYRARLWGAEAMSFPTIVASGERSAMPHGTATEAKLPRRGFVTLDFGVILNGYCSDMTRTVHLGRAGTREREAYEAVLAAQENAVAAVARGREVRAMWTRRRAACCARRSWRSTSRIRRGMEWDWRSTSRRGSRMAQQALLTEEGWSLPSSLAFTFRVRSASRIEDTVVVERRGCRVLTPATKAWIEL